MELTDQERATVRDVGFDEALLAKARWLLPGPLERLRVLSLDGLLVTGPGVSVAVKDGDEAERVRNAILPLLATRGYRVFWSNRCQESGLSETDELAILKTEDLYAMVRLCNTNGGNYGIMTDDIIDRLRAWEETCTFDVVGASHDWVALQFSRLPEKLCAFAEEIYTFCPDTVEQGIGLKHERDNPALFQAARQLCPHVRAQSEGGEFDVNSLPPEMREQMAHLIAKMGDPKETSEMGVRLLAQELKDKRYLFLWWD